MERGMNRWKIAQARAQRPGLEFLKTQAKFAAIAAAAAAPLLLLLSLTPRALALPVVCLLAIAGALFIATFAWWRGAISKPDRVSFWDVAGALALIGFAAGMLSEPDQVLHLSSVTR
jgi:hypothetical protein